MRRFIYLLFILSVMFTSCTKPSEQTNYAQNSVEQPTGFYEGDTKGINWRDKYIDEGVLVDTSAGIAPLIGTKWVITHYTMGFTHMDPNDTIIFISENRYDFHSNDGVIIPNLVYMLSPSPTGQFFNFILRDIPTFGGSGDLSGAVQPNAITYGTITIINFSDENTYSNLNFVELKKQ